MWTSVLPLASGQKHQCKLVNRLPRKSFGQTSTLCGERVGLTQSYWSCQSAMSSYWPPAGRFLTTYGVPSLSEMWWGLLCSIALTFRLYILTEVYVFVPFCYIMVCFTKQCVCCDVKMVEQGRGLWAGGGTLAWGSWRNVLDHPWIIERAILSCFMLSKNRPVAALKTIKS